MKRATMFTIALCAVCFLFSYDVKAQDVTGKTFVNAGIGLGSFNMVGTGGFPLVLSVEHGFHEKISGGVYVGYIQRRYGSYWKYKYIVVGARASYHVNELLKIDQPKVDLYGGATLYYRGYKLKYTEDHAINDDVKSSGGNVGIAFHAGGRYMFAEKVGAFAEVGYGISPLVIGVTVGL